LGALVFKGKRVISNGFSKNKSHPLLAKYGYYAIHAECDAILRASEGDTLLVVRILKNGKFACSKPCAKCLKFAKDYGIKTIFFVDWDGKIQQLSL
jgi:deoxycytidylate deaminase